MSPQERAHIERTTGPIERVVISYCDVEVSWAGRTIWAQVTERVALLGPAAAFVADRCVEMQIEQRSGGWRVVRGWVLPPLRAARDGTVVPIEHCAPLH